MKKCSMVFLAALFVLAFASEISIGYQLYPTGEAGKTKTTSKISLKKNKKLTNDQLHQQKLLKEFTIKNTQKRPYQMPEQDPRDIEPSTQI